ncbi:glutamate synthase-related protein [Plebeiibacterium marinum]|uniref:Glutamate synthase-related protein n=1 Tax=Plebeiibacterium marinum TaxID=2992111 RepID=A0AAE3SL64_9BACT|nr:glutamate synthase-related protein [Plebeiobacterium marinum]
MAVYKCLACGNEYDEEKEGVKWQDLPGDWICPVCGVAKDMFESIGDQDEAQNSAEDIDHVDKGDYLSKWKKSGDDNEQYFNDIHTIAETGKSIAEPMKTKMPLVSWNDILFKGAQLSKLPINTEVEVNTKTVIGPRAKHPLVIEIPIYISHMSFGALSKEIKVALAKGSAAVKTLICSGEGGILPEEFENAYKYIYEYIPNKYSLTDENLRKVDAVEIKIGQSAKPGMGGHLPGSKVTREIAHIRGKREGEDIHSPACYPDIRNKEELKSKVDWLREKTGGKPIGVKIAAGNIEEDLDVVLYANPDFITIDGRGGATGSAPKHIKDHTSVPTIFALNRARKYLDANNIVGVSLIITGGLRVSSDFAKALAMGADAVAIATAGMIAGGCQQYRVCNTGKCPVGIATQDNDLRKRLDVDKSAKRIENFLKVSSAELKDFARITGNVDVHGMDIKDVCTTNSEISDYTDIDHV